MFIFQVKKNVLFVSFSFFCLKIRNNISKDFPQTGSAEKQSTRGGGQQDQDCPGIMIDFRDPP